jgi:hypothetical protein
MHPELARVHRADPDVDITVAQLIHAIASFDTWHSSEGALFEPVSAGALHEEFGIHAPDRHILDRYKYD